MLLPIIFHIDGAETGQFANLPVTAVKFTLGIFNQAAREKPHMWRTLGYLPVIQKTKSRERRQLVSSSHNELINALADMDEDESNEATINVTAPQDLHTMLEVI